MDAGESPSPGSRKRWLKWAILPVLLLTATVGIVTLDKPEEVQKPPDMAGFPPKWKEVTLVDEGYMRLKPCGRGVNAFCLDSLPDGYFLEHTFNDTTQYGKVTAFHLEEEGRYLVDVEFGEGRKGRYELRLLEHDRSIAAWSLDGKPVALMMAEGMYRALKQEFDECKAAAETSGWYYGNVGTLADTTLDGLLRKVVRRANTVFLGVTDSAMFRLAGDLRFQRDDLAGFTMRAVNPAEGGRLEPFTLLCVHKDSLWITLSTSTPGDYLGGRIDTMLPGPEGNLVLLMRGMHPAKEGQLAAYQYPAIYQGHEQKLYRSRPLCESFPPDTVATTWHAILLKPQGEGEDLTLLEEFYTTTFTPEDKLPFQKTDSTRLWKWDPPSRNFTPTPTKKPTE